MELWESEILRQAQDDSSGSDCGVYPEDTRDRPNGAPRNDKYHKFN